MRPHGRAQTSRTWPRAHAVCDRCGFRYNHDQLKTQPYWAGPQLQIKNILVCETCWDVPQENIRTIIIPPDPIPIDNPRPEQYVSDNNPNSGIGQAPLPSLTGTNIGTIVQGGGTWAAFDGNTVKPFRFSSYLGVSGSSFANWVGKNWAANPGGPGPVITGMSTVVQQYLALGFTMTAPRDRAFLGSSLPTNYAFQGSSNGTAWTTLANGTTAGTAGESITVTAVSGVPYQYHRLALSGDGVNSVSIAQLAINTNRGIGGVGGA